MGEFLEELGEAGRRRDPSWWFPHRTNRLCCDTCGPRGYDGCGIFLRAQAKQVLLVVDSLTRFAMAQREIGLAAGEPPTAKGYTPSCLHAAVAIGRTAGRFAHGQHHCVLYRADGGRRSAGSAGDAVRSLLDGHVLLDRELAARGHYPPISILNSLSRLMPAVCSDEHRNRAAELRSLLALYTRSEDLVRIGAYQKGTDKDLDKALSMLPRVEDFLRQDSAKMAKLDDNIQQLLALGN